MKNLSKDETVSFLRIQNLYKTFNQVVAVDRLNLNIDEGEFFTLLGSSGCGKTTTLRLIGGLEKPDGGEIYLGENCLASQKIFIKPEKRHMGMVFQSYALWPHMTVFENVVYPLRLRGIKGAEAEKKVAEVLGVVGLSGLEERPAPALSGGQQQRVALARALIFSPRVLLLDEPLSNLDAQLREEMRRELKALQQRLKINVLFVTHDQMEALSLSDRIAIMKSGKLEQIGTPEEVYYRPATPFVRDFLGKTFLLPGTVLGVTDQQVNVQLHQLNALPLAIQRTSIPTSANGSLSVGQAVTVAIRPEKISLWGNPPEGRSNLIPAHLQAAQFLGDRYEYTVALGAETRVLVATSEQSLKTGASVFLELHSEDITLWSREA
ncbi:MAG TPA: ABC transporter ATP-binding protein [Candidatus Acidoferrales bacterium]|nr:ABC transporter ATP-binding protein [Candidatus Acidoferrales bacterium]